MVGTFFLGGTVYRVVLVNYVLLYWACRASMNNGMLINWQLYYQRVSHHKCQTKTQILGKISHSLNAIFTLVLHMGAYTHL